MTTLHCSRTLYAIGLMTALASWPLAAEDRQQWQQPERVMADLGLKPGQTVADVGCGSGYFTFRLAEAVWPHGKVFALDPDANAIGKVRERVEKEKRANIDVLVSEPTNTKLPDASCDAVLLCLVLHEAAAEARQPLVRDIARALKPGGMLFIIDHRQIRENPLDPYEKLIAREDLLKLATDAGLVLDGEFYYLKYQVFLRCRKPGK